MVRGRARSQAACQACAARLSDELAQLLGRRVDCATLRVVEALPAETHAVEHLHDVREQPAGRVVEDCPVAARVEDLDLFHRFVVRVVADDATGDQDPAVGQTDEGKGGTLIVESAGDRPAGVQEAAA